MEKGVSLSMWMTVCAAGIFFLMPGIGLSANSVPKSGDLVKCDASGQILLVPRAAVFGGGSGIQRNGSRDHIAWLDDPGAIATWNLDIDASGMYQVEVEYFMPWNKKTKVQIKTPSDMMVWVPAANSPTSRFSDTIKGNAGSVSLKKGINALMIRSTTSRGWINVAGVRLVVALPGEVLRMVKVYQTQKEEVDGRFRDEYMERVRKRQKVAAQREQFEEVTVWEKEIKRVDKLSAQELFASEGGSCPVAGRWFRKEKNGKKSFTLDVDTDGMVSRPEESASWNRSVVRMSEDGKSFRFVDEVPQHGIVCGVWSVVDDNTCSEIWQGRKSIFVREPAKLATNQDCVKKLLKDVSSKWGVAAQLLRSKYVSALKKTKMKYDSVGNVRVSARLTELIENPDQHPMDI